MTNRCICAQVFYVESHNQVFLDAKSKASCTFGTPVLGSQNFCTKTPVTGHYKSGLSLSDTMGITTSELKHSQKKVDFQRLSSRYISLTLLIV